MCKKLLLIAAVIVAGRAACLVSAAGAGEATLPAILPPDTIACIVPAEDQALEYAFSNSLFRRLGELPEMAGFINSLEESRHAIARDLAANAAISQELAWEIINARLGGALINIGVDRQGKPRPEFMVVMQLRAAPDRQQIFSAVRALLNRREVVKAALESQGIDPNLPIKTLAQEETIPGYPSMLRIGPNLRVTVIGRMIVLYNGPGADGIKTIFDATQNPAASLAGTQLFQAVWQGSGAQPGMAFTYINLPRLMTILDAAGMSSVTRVADALGLSTAQALGLAGGYQKDGMRHNLYLHMPNPGSGLLSTLMPMPAGSQSGMEIYSHFVPAQSEAFMALRLNFPAFLEEMPYFAEAVGGVTRPGGMSGYLANETILGVPVREFANVLGDDLVFSPHDDTQVALFANADLAGFERLVAAMEQNAGTRFRTLDVGGYKIRYFNQRSDAVLPLAPAFCLIPNPQSPGKGLLYAASHPQALVSLIRDAVATPKPISGEPDFAKAIQGLESAYSLFYYADCRDSYRRFYNAVLPLASLWASSGSYPVDTGLLPTASTVMPGLFGCAFGIKVQPQGLAVQAYSPVGINAVAILLADKLILSNPIILGYMHSWALELRETIPW